MNETHRVELSSPEEALQQGYQPCSYCLPKLPRSSKSAPADGPRSSP